MNTAKKRCPECGGPMEDWGEDTIKEDTGEHYLCYVEHYWSCLNVRCDGDIAEMIGYTWNEPYQIAQDAERNRSAGSDG